METYEVTEKGRHALADRKLADAQAEIERGTVDVSDRFAAAESLEHAVELIAEARKLLRDTREGWSEASSALRSR